MMREGGLIRKVLFLLCVCASAAAGAQSWQLFSSFQNVGGTSDETARQILQSADGSLFTLSTSGSGLVVAKRDASGTPVWHSFYPARPSGLALAPDGGLAVITRVDRGLAPAANEMLLLRYDPSGTLLWTKLLGTCTGQPDPALRVMFDPAGDIYIGATVNQDAFSDLELIKLSPTGDPVWSKTLGPNPDQEICLGLTLDASGNILLFGNRNPSSTAFPVIYKFGPEGTQIWGFVANVNGVAGNFAVDSTGASYLPVAGLTPAAIKVSPAGKLVWKTFIPAINVPMAVALAGAASYVAGTQAGNGKCFVAKIGTNGGVTWIATHTGPSGEQEALNSIVVAPTGAVYAAGNRAFTGSQAIFTLGVSPAGAVAWSADHGVYTYTPPIIPPLVPVPPPLIPTTLLLDSAARPTTYSTINGPGSPTGYDNEVCVDSTAGVLATSKASDLNGTNDFADASVTDATGNTYVLADSQQGGGADVILQQFNPNGSLGWLKGAGGPGPDMGYALCLVPGGGVETSFGIFYAGTTMWDTFVRRYDASGNVLWACGPLDGSNHIAAMAVGTDGATYLVGQDQVTSPFRFHVVKITSGGTVAWSTTFPGFAPMDDFPFKLQLDASNNVYVVGNLYDGVRYLASLQKYDSATGAVLWTQTYASSGAGAEAFSLLVSGNGVVYMGGVDWASGGRGLIRKFDSNGNLLDAFICAEPDTVSERYLSLAQDSAGNLIVAGAGVLPNKNVDLLAAEYTSSGTLIWKQLYDGPSGTFDVGRYLKIGPFGDIYVAGNLSGPNGKDYVLWRLNPDGSAGWPDSGDVFAHSAMIFDSGQKLADTLMSVGVDSLDNVYVAGAAVGPGMTYDLHAMKFGPTLGSQLSSQTVPATMVAGQTYTVAFNFNNTSNIAWTGAGAFGLGSVNPTDNLAFGVNRRPLLPTDVVQPGSSAKFSFLVYAPTVGGTYNLQWSMRQDAIGPFGDPSTNVPVVVTVAPDAARYLSQSQPSTVKVGTSFTVKVKMTNVGTNPWTLAGAYALAPSGSSSNWGVTQLSVGSTAVNQGQTKTFTFLGVAPATAGSYTMRFQMRNASGFFGDKTALKTITVTN